MSRREVWFWIVGVVVLTSAGLFISGFDIFDLLPWLKSGNLYEDPQGRFSMQIDPSWEKIKTDGAYTQFRSVNPPMNLYMLVGKAKTVRDAFSQDLEIVGFDPGLLNGANAASSGDWQLLGQVDSAGLNYSLAGQIVGENAYIMLVKANKPGVTVQNGPVMGALSSLKITGN